MSDANIRTARTIVQALLTIIVWLAAFLPGLLDDLGVDPVSVPSLAMFLAILAAVARLSQSGVLDRVLTGVGLGKQGRHEAE